MTPPRRPRTFTRRARLAPGTVLLAADRWAAAMFYPRELTADAAAFAAGVHVDEHGGDATVVIEAFTAAAARATATVDAAAAGTVSA